MDGLDLYGTEDEVGFDYMSMVKGAAGMLSGAGGLMSGGGGGDSAAAEKARLEEAKRKAEASASTMKIVLIILGVLAGVGGLTAVAVLGRRKK